ncbi:hypothetical protein IMG5_187580 [Ichthyophthirius multifiliis]|uniref:Potassium channel domain-containing protein n=1 Tax=Ichthyophthirius multifiliis TaxID=5932 RepID=G0R3U6_ICHMU|nr:hypothetical protein IMG5_187580 [Ichthyophthirius multifiliis]EGR27853.1 hypothetical protein IMG5_187580 [Ichthyophthirius multifiliis]|eukprot:XP_004027198.1 hypothetical protein IMG5_187580 [Ichthyophthirius multifiliis]
MNKQNWIKEANLDQENFLTKYINSLYWAIITMLTVGYGEIHPNNELEKLTCIFITVFSCGIYAYTLNRIGVLIQEITEQDTEFKQNFSLLSQYMKRRNLGLKIQRKVKQYFKYLHWEKHNYNENGQHMLNFLLELAPEMKERTYRPDDIVWQASDLQFNKNNRRGQLFQSEMLYY